MTPDPLIPLADIFSVINKFNPWWEGRQDNLPGWKRSAFGELLEWIENPPSRRAVLLSGARQVGKTTLLRQAAVALVNRGVGPRQILYATFDHPILKLIGLEGLLAAWEELRPSTGREYLLLDEIQYARDWQTWLKHEVDFNERRRIVVTGSAIPLVSQNPESGVGRWHTIKLPTLSFFEYLKLKNIPVPSLPVVRSFYDLFSWTPAARTQAAISAKPLVAHFHEYLLRGGFPEAALVEDVHTAQKLLREDIVDKVLKRDMTAQFGTRRIIELEKTFLYLCLHDGGVVDMSTLCSHLGVTKSTAANFLDLFEAAHLVYKLSPYGYGKAVLKGKHKYYLADPAISGSVLLKGGSLLEDGPKLGAAVETAFFKHVFTAYYLRSIGFSYWRKNDDLEVDIVAQIEDHVIPFEVKYSQKSLRAADLKGLLTFCSEKSLNRGYVICRNATEFELLTHDAPAQILKIPAPLACYWLSCGHMAGSPDESS